MKTLSKQNTFYLAAIACLALAVSMPAFAQNVQVQRTEGVQTITGGCPPCYDVGTGALSVTEPATVTPVVVTWSADYNVSGTSIVGLIVNGGPCTAYGPFTLQQPQLAAGSASITTATTHQWVVLPSDGLVKGANFFTVCAGGYQGVSRTINIGYSTTTVQLFPL